MAPQDHETVRIQLLGGFRVDGGAGQVPVDAWQRRSARALVKLLAVEPSHRLHREQVEEMLWPDHPPGSASGQLRKALHYARHALEPDLAPRQASAYLQASDELLSLNAERCWIDADAFEAAASGALARGEIDALREAASHYTGEMLPEDRYEDWTTARRQALASQYQGLLMETAAIHERRGARELAIGSCRQLLREEACQEEAHRRIMRLAAASGKRHEALRQYQACKAALRQELDTEPEPETRQLYRDILAGRAVPEAPVTTPLPAVVRRQSERPMLGRRETREMLCHELEQAASGEGRAVLVRGEMGVGKSRLLADLAYTAHQRGSVVLWGAAYEQEDHLPYGPFAEALEGFVAAQPDAERERIAAGHPDLASLLPSLGSALAELPMPRQDQRAQLFASVARLLTGLSRSQPLLLVMDDLHTTDTSSLQLLHHLARSARDHRWLIVGAYREDVTAGSALQQLTSARGDSDPFHHITVARLAREECGSLIAGMVDGDEVAPALLDAVYTRSLGNILFATEIMNALVEHGSAIRAGTTWTLTDPGAIQVPGHVRELVEARVDRLGGDTGRVLALIATAGPGCSFSLLRDATSLDEPALLDALDTALVARVIEEHDDGYAFVHPIFRPALYERLARPRRASMHAALAASLDAQQHGGGQPTPATIEALAHHWTEAGEPARAVPCLIDAADHAARVYANADAIHRLQRALALLDSPAFPTDQGAAYRAGISKRLGDLYALTGNTMLGHHAYLTALKTGALLPLEAAGAHRLAASQSLAMNDLADAETHITTAYDLLRDVESGPASEIERLRLQLATAQARFLARRFPEALDLAESSLRLADRLGSDADRVQSMEMASMACLPLGFWERGLGYERKHAGLVDLNRFVRDISDVHFCFADYHVYARAPVDAARTFERAIDEAERIDAPRSIALCRYYLGVMAFFRGRFGEALAHETGAIEIYQRVGSSFGEAIARQIRGVSLTALGQLDAGRDELERGLELARDGVLRSHAQIRLYAGLVRNRIDANDAEGARRYAEAGLALTEEPSTCICYASFLPGAAMAMAVSFDLETAIALGERALTAARSFESPAFICMAQQANGLIAAMTGRWEPAFAALDEAQYLAKAHHFPHELARVLLARSFVHMQRRDRGDLKAATGLMAEVSPRLMRLGVRASAAQMRSSMGFLRDHAGTAPSAASAD